MTQYELTKYNIGQNLDNLMNLDPRGYGVCRILYKASRNYSEYPTSMNFAEKLLNAVKDENSSDIVYIISGFILPPHNKPETDGIIGAAELARTLVLLGKKPVIICPEKNIPALEAMLPLCGLHLYHDIEEFLNIPFSVCAIAFTTDRNKAVRQAEELLNIHKPAAVVSTEAPGANKYGIYHNASGIDVSDEQAKTDVLFLQAKKRQIPNFAIGDLGNEIGMGTLQNYIQKFVPYATVKDNVSGCSCPCGGGIMSESSADVVLTATVSDWGMCAVIAAMAWLENNIKLMHSPELEEELIVAASRSGMVNMYGDLSAAIDGQDKSVCSAIVKLMYNTVESSILLKDTCKKWFDGVLSLGYFDRNEDI